jgi:hypothetical protein
MSIDVEGLRSTIRKIKRQIARRHIVGLDEDVIRLEQIAAAAEAKSPNGGGLPAAGLKLPPEIVVPHPDVIAEYLSGRPGLANQVQTMAAALLEDFRNDRSEIELVVYQDPEIDDRQLTFYVRLAEYDDSLMPRLHTVVEQVERQFPPSSDWILVTTDHRSIA